MAEVDQPVEDRGRLERRFDLEPDSFGAEFEAELEETAASLLTPSKVCSGEQGILAVFESQASRPCAPGDLEDPKVHELSPLVDPSAGAIRRERTGNRDAGHVNRLLTGRVRMRRGPIRRFTSVGIQSRFPWSRQEPRRSFGPNLGGSEAVVTGSGCLSSHGRPQRTPDSSYSVVTVRLRRWRSPDGRRRLSVGRTVDLRSHDRVLIRGGPGGVGHAPLPLTTVSRWTRWWPSSAPTATPSTRRSSTPDVSCGPRWSLTGIWTTTFRGSHE